MEVIREAPPPLPPKSKKVRQTLKEAAHSENASTLPSSAVLKQKLIIKEASRSGAGDKRVGVRARQDDVTSRRAEPAASPPSHRDATVTESISCQSVDPSVVESYRTNFSNTLAKFVNGNESQHRSRLLESIKQLNHGKVARSNGVVNKIASAFCEPKKTTWVESKKLNEGQLVNKNSFEWNRKDNGVQEDDFLYQNVSNSGTNYIEYKLNGFINKDSKIKSGSNRKNHKETSASKQILMIAGGNLSKKSDPEVRLGRNKVTEKGEEKTGGWNSPRTSQIEVHQVKNKTVVKISINDNVVSNFANLNKDHDEIKCLSTGETHFKPLRVEESECDEPINDYQYPDVLFSSKPVSSGVNEYAEPFSNSDSQPELKDTGNYQRPGQVYANIDKSKKKNRRNEKTQENNSIYENSDILEKDEQFYANVTNDEDCYANVIHNHPVEQFYANLNDNADTELHYPNHASGKSPVTAADPDQLVYANVEPELEEEVEEDEGDQVYENQEFEVLKNSKVTQSLIEKNPVPVAKEVTVVRKEEPVVENGVYENHDVFEVDDATYENTNLPQINYVTKKGITLQKKVDPPEVERENPKTVAEEHKQPKPCVRVTVNKTGSKGESEMLQQNKTFKNQYFFHDAFSQKENGNVDDGQYSPSDTFDSGTCSDLDSLPPPLPAKTKNGKVIVTINNQNGFVQDKTEVEAVKTEQKEICSERNAQNEMDNETHVGHKRAESLTSSGVGVDSEESDGEGSNISCDSLNSNELNGLSMSEDHGYHTPNSENKTGSPIEGVEYQNMSKTNTPSPELKQNGSFENGQVSAFTLYKDSKSFEEVKHTDAIIDNYDNTDIIQQVANVAQKIKNLRSESTGIYLAKRIESTNDDVYENFRVFEKKPSSKKKQAPPPPTPPKPKVTSVQKMPEEADDVQNEVKSLPKGLLHDIRSRTVRLSSTYPTGEKTAVTTKETPITKTIVNFNLLTTRSSPKQTKPMTLRQLKKVKQSSSHEDKRSMVDERTYEERKVEHEDDKVTKICAMEIDTDKFYKFHLFENREEVNVDKNSNDDETFAGVKDYLNREKPAAITSAKGTIRGVKNRVKAGIATFLQMQEHKPYKDKDAGKIVLYSTTMGIVRETYHKCLKVKQILRTLMVKFEERDAFMSTDAQDEIRERMKCDAILVPQVFVEGQHIGDAETIERLNESGELRKILKPYKSPDACSTCQVCGGYRLLPCRICKGSKKSVHRNSFTAEFVSLKCMNCDQVGLTKCHAC